MGRARCALKERDDPAHLLLEFLRRQPVDTRRTFSRLPGADGVRTMIKDQPAQLVVPVAKRQHRQLRIERTGWTHEVCARTDPVNLAVIQQHPAILAYALFFSEPEEELAWREICRRAVRGLHD